MTIARPDDQRSSPTTSFAFDVRQGLGAPQKTLPCKYFYDDVGARLFDEITTLPEYYPTRTELAILRAHAGVIALAVGPGARLVELGSGEGEKTPLLLDALASPAAYVPVDISESQLLVVADRFRARYPGLVVTPIAADYTAPFTLPPPPPGTGRTFAYFAGSTIGNFEPAAATAFLARVRTLVGPGGAALIGVDWEKDRAVLEAAYNDAANVTASFNKNLLVRINRELDGDIDLDTFAHRAEWQAEAGRIEMQLVSKIDQTCHADGLPYAFVAGETIVTEHCYKYDAARFESIARAAGFRCSSRYQDELGYFSLELLTPGLAGLITGERRAFRAAPPRRRHTRDRAPPRGRDGRHGASRRPSCARRHRGPGRPLRWARARTARSEAGASRRCPPRR
jgi:dimethylhistidine N-methyltransferase